MSMVNSTIVSVDNVDESIVDGLIDQFGKLPSFFDVTVVVTVIVDPLPEAPNGEEVQTVPTVSD